MMKKFLHRSILFFSPLALVVLLEVFVLPINFFNYRCYEALSAYYLASPLFLSDNYKLNRLLTLPGPFYPNQQVEMTEEGDLGYYTSYARGKKGEWITDRYGFRVRDRQDGRWDIVIIGDSFVVGSGVSQNETLAEALQRRTGQSAYPYNFSVPRFFREKRFLKQPPKILVLAFTERNLRSIYLPPQPDAIVALPDPSTARWKNYLLTQVDRWMKSGIWRFLRASIRRTLIRTFIDSKEPLPSGVVVSNNGAMLFLASDLGSPPTFEQIEELANIIKSFAQQMEKKNIRVIVMPIPEKSAIYGDLLGPTAPPSAIPDFVFSLARHGVERIYLTPAFVEARRRGEDTYFADDTHWNARGIEIAAELLAGQIGGKQAAGGR